MATKINSVTQADRDRAFAQGHRTASPSPCPRSNDQGPHLTYGGTVCAMCGQETTPETPETPSSPQAFREGEALAYRRVLALLTALPADLASRGRDEGRGAAHAVREIYEAVMALAQDAGVDL